MDGWRGWHLGRVLVGCFVDCLLLGLGGGIVVEDEIFFLFPLSFSYMSSTKAGRYDTLDTPN